MGKKRFAVLGYGTVGKAVCRVWDELADAPLEQGPILVRRAQEPDAFSGLMTDRFDAIEADPTVTVVAEVMGGTDDAWEYSRRALLAGKSVVSSNKALAAARGAELCALAHRMGVSYRFEAAVCGGVPLLAPLTESLAANRVDELCGIFNGTTNYILTAMRRGGVSYAESLSQAQALGYAEADPTADVQGHDAGRKTALLGSLAFGKSIRYDAMHVAGISEIAPVDLELADALGFSLKLLGRTGRAPEGLYAFVQPHLVPRSALLSSVDGVMNACLIRASAAGELMFYGPGAGGRPTASAVCADILAAARHPGDCMELSAEHAALLPEKKLVSRWYIRAESEPGPLLAAFPSARPVYGTGGGCAFITEPCRRTELGEKLRAANAVRAWRVLDI